MAPKGVTRQNNKGLQDKITSITNRATPWHNKPLPTPTQPQEQKATKKKAMSNTKTKKRPPTSPRRHNLLTPSKAWEGPTITIPEDDPCSLELRPHWVFHHPQQCSNLFKTLRLARRMLLRSDDLRLPLRSTSSLRIFGRSCPLWGQFLMCRSPLIHVPPWKPLLGTNSMFGWVYLPGLGSWNVANRRLGTCIHRVVPGPAHVKSPCSFGCGLS